MLPRHLLAEVFHAAYWTMQETSWLGEGNPEADLEQTGKFMSPHWLLNTSVSPMRSWKLVGGRTVLPGSHIQIKGRTWMTSEFFPSLQLAPLVSSTSHEQGFWQLPISEQTNPRGAEIKNSHLRVTCRGSPILTRVPVQLWTNLICITISKAMLFGEGFLYA